MSLLDRPGDSGSSFESKASFSAFLDDENDEEDSSPTLKEKGKLRHGDLDTQKNTFSLRRKHKEKDRESGLEGRAGKKVKHVRNKSYSHSPPDSPKLKQPETSRKGTKNQPGSPRSHRKDYAHLLENDFSSGEDEEEFLLSKGHVAREKRASAIGSKTPPRDLLSSTNSKPAAMANLSFVATSPSHPSTLDTRASFTSSLPPTVGPSTVQAFPVQFANSSEAPLPDDVPASPDRSGVSAAGSLSFDTSFSSPMIVPHSPPASSLQPVIPLLPPPPSAVTSATSVGSTASSSSMLNSTSSGAVAFQPSVLPLPWLSQTSPFLDPQQLNEAPAVTQPPQAPAITLSPQAPTMDWSVSQELRQKCVEQFKQIKSGEGLLSGETARNFFLQSKLPVDELSKIWKLSDVDKDGCLSVEEFIVAMKLVMMRRGNHEIPTTLPEELRMTVKKTPRESSSPRFKFAFPPPPSKASKGQAPSLKQPQSRPLLQAESSVQTAFSTLAVAGSDVNWQAEAQNPARSVSLGFESQFEDEKEPTTHVMVDDHLYTLVNVKNKDNKHAEASKSSSILDDSFASDTPWNVSSEDVELLPSSSQAGDPVSIVISESGDAAVGHLVSIDDGSSPVDSDDISSLMDEPKDRAVKKKPAKSRSQHSKKRTPPRPQPYQNRPRASTSPPPLSSDEDNSFSSRTDSLLQSMDSDTQLMISASKAAPPKPVMPKPAPPKPVPPKTRPKPVWITKAHTEQQLPMGLESLRHKEEEEEQSKEKTHNRSTSWDLTKMIREEHGMSVHEDLPSAEPPKPPPRRPLSDTKEDNTLHPIQRSASTGSLASIGTPAGLQKSRSPSTGSGSLVATLELSQMDHLLPIKARRPAPAPPPPKPKSKKPILPPTHKKVEPEVPSTSSDSDDRPLLTDSYQKKSKNELLQAISQLKEDNTLYSQLNEHLNDKLNQLIKQRTSLELQLQRLSSSNVLT